MSVKEIESQLDSVEKEALDAFGTTKNLAELENLRQKYLGKKGTLNSILRGLGNLDKDEKPKVGQLANQVKERIESFLVSRKDELYEEELLEKLETEKIDITLPGTRQELGHLHPLYQITEEIIEIFYAMGFSVASGPEVETEYYNFEAWNTPHKHPAREEPDTFYTDIAPSTLLRSQ